MDRLEGFASLHGPAFYGLPVNQEQVTLVRRDQLIPSTVEGLVPFHAGDVLSWRLAGPVSEERADVSG